MATLSEIDVELRENKEKNEGYLEIFAKWLENKGLAEKTINKHISNMNFYLNCFLTYYDTIPMEKGWLEVDNFLGDWYIQKSLIVSRKDLKATATSIKRFYECMSEKGYIKNEQYKDMCKGIKDNMDEYLENIAGDGRAYLNFPF